MVLDTIPNTNNLQLYDINYSYIILIIYVQLYGLKKLFLFNNHLFAHSYMVSSIPLK